MTESGSSNDDFKLFLCIIHASKMNISGFRTKHLKASVIQQMYPFSFGVDLKSIELE